MMRTIAETAALIEPGHLLVDQTPVGNFTEKLLVREEQLVQNGLKHLIVGHVHSKAKRRSD